MFLVLFFKLRDFQNTFTGGFIHLHIRFTGKIIKAYIKNIGNFTSDLKQGDSLGRHRVQPPEHADQK